MKAPHLRVSIHEFRPGMTSVEVEVSIRNPKLIWLTEDQKNFDTEKLTYPVLTKYIAKVLSANARAMKLQAENKGQKSPLCRRKKKVKLS